MHDNEKAVKKSTTSLVCIVTIFLWASAFVGIRYGLHGYHPGSLALLRYGVASVCMLFIYYFLPNKTAVNKKDIPLIFLCGILGIGLYNITLNYGELSVTAAIASFTISQAPVVSTIFAIFFFGERPKLLGILGIIISFIGVLLIAYSNQQHASTTTSSIGIYLIIISVLCSSLYAVLQKPLLGRINPIQFACYAIWAGTLLLLIYTPQLYQDLQTASTAAIAYILWSYLLSQGSITKSVSLLYVIPLATMLLGWLCLGEVPQLLSLTGGVIALLGAYLVRH